MESYHFWADALNKFSQLTPWVQAFLGLAVCAVPLGLAHFLKEMTSIIMRPLYKQDVSSPPKKQWHDKYYRGEMTEAKAEPLETR
jgi:hypothetical protein